MKIAFDLDGVLREERPHSEKLFAAPIQNAINACNGLYYIGHHIVIFTACGWPDYNITKKWLDDNGVKYHQLICGKYNYDYFVEDRSVKSATELMEKLNA